MRPRPVHEHRPARHVLAQRCASARCTIAYATSFDHVWFATREEIAQWYLKNHHSHIA
jgi:hypothetical protein